MSNMSIADQSKWPGDLHWEGACILQLDYNVLLFSGRKTFLIVLNEKVLFNRCTLKGSFNVYSHCTNFSVWGGVGERGVVVCVTEFYCSCREFFIFNSLLFLCQGMELLVFCYQTSEYLWQVILIAGVSICHFAAVLGSLG